MYSLLIKNARIADGLGNPWVHGDVALDNERIAVIGRLDGQDAERVIDGKGLVLAPGFIDMHSHAELIYLDDQQPDLLEGKIRQGVTTEIIGNCGIGLAPVQDDIKSVVEASVGWMTPAHVPWSWHSMAEFLDRVAAARPVINVGTLTGHGAIRASVMGFDAGIAGDGQVREMRELLETTFDEGSFGLSTGLIYAPGMFSDTDELLDLCEAVADHDRVYTSHIRGSSETDVEAHQEVITIGEKTGCRVHRSHYEAFGADNWSKIGTTLAMDEAARARGVDIGFDMFPYTAAMTMMIAIYPPWALDGGWPAFAARVGDPSTRRRIAHDIENLVPTWPTWQAGAWPHNLVRATGWHNIQIGYIPSTRNKRYEGLSLTQLAEETGKTPFDAITDLLIEEEGAISQLIFGVSGDRDQEGPLRTVLQHHLGGFATDAIDIGRGMPHPAAYGTFPRILGRYVREEKLLSMEDAIRRMTSFPASRLGIRDRGIIREGYYADLVLFDPETIADNATYEHPRQPSTGVEWVIVNGQPLLERGKLLGKRGGQVLRR